MMIETKVTVKMLRELGASCYGLADFERVFPQGAAITRENCLLAARARLNVDWFARQTLPATARETYYKRTAPAMKAGTKRIAAAMKACGREIATAREAYEQAIATAEEACGREIAAAREACGREIAAAREAYGTKVALIFFRIYKRELKKGASDGNNA